MNQRFNIDLTQQQLKLLQKRHPEKGPKDAIIAILLAAAGMYVLGEILSDEEKKAPNNGRKK